MEIKSQELVAEKFSLQSDQVKLEEERGKRSTPQERAGRWEPLEGERGGASGVRKGLGISSIPRPILV